MRPFVRALGAGAIAISATGCSNIWGFEDPVPLRDGGSNDAALAEASQEGDAPDACTCMPPAPDSWQGPFELFESAGTPPRSPPDCGGAYPFARFDGVASEDPGPATCGCSCGAPTDVVCTVVATLYADGKCNTGCGMNGKPTSAPIGAACTTLDTGPCGGVHADIGAPVPSGGRCTPEPKVDAGALRPSGRVRLCGVTADAGTSLGRSPAACSTGGICAPAPETGFNPRALCIIGAGRSACPAGTPYAYARTVSYHETSTDTRACGSCTCSAPTATCGNATVSTYMDNMGMAGCTGPAMPVSLPADCIPAASVAYPGSAPTAASCSPTLGPAIGAPSPPAICCTSP